MAEDELKKYSTGAYVPEEGGSAAGGMGVSGNTVMNSTSVSGNGSVGAGEGLEGASRVKAGYEEGIGEKAQGGALESVEKMKRAGKTSKKVFAGVIVALVVVILVAVGITVAVIWGSKELVTEVVEPEKPVDKDGIVELSLDDEVVQKLHREFEYYAGINGFGFTGFYQAINSNDSDLRLMAMTNKAIYNLQSKDCIGTYDEYGIYVCYSGDEVRGKTRELFGMKPSEDDDSVFVFGSCGDYTTYNADLDEYVMPTGCGGTGPVGLNRWLYKAEKSGSELYIYELAAVISVVFDENDEYIGNEYCHTDKSVSEETCDIKLDLADNEVLVSNGREVPDGYVGVDVIKFADKLDQYKWTFQENEEGNYIFEGLEKVN